MPVEVAIPLIVFIVSVVVALALARAGGRMEQTQMELPEDRPFAYALTIACTFCGAPVGEPCTQGDTGYTVEPHNIRRRQAALKPVTEEDK